MFAWIYARSAFLCSLELENVNLNLDGRICTFFSTVPGKHAHLCLLQTAQSAKMPTKAALTLMWRKPL